MGRPRKPKPETENTGHNGSTGLDRQKVASLTERIENLHDDLETEKSEYMTRCKAIREDISETYQEAKDTAGITKRAFKAKVKERLLKKRMANCRDNLEPEQIDMFDLLSMALGEIDEKPARQTLGEKMREPGGPLDEHAANPAG